MDAIINGFDWLITFFKTIFDIISYTFETITMVFRYLGTIILTCTAFVATLPSWLQAFGLITISVTAIYFVIGREAGKSD